MSKHLLIEAVKEEHVKLKVCDRHPRRVWYEEKECPVCSAVREVNLDS